MTIIGQRERVTQNRKKTVVCLEYMLVHELVHLLEASHNARFHTLMTHFLPNWQERKALLTAYPIADYDHSSENHIL